MIEANPKARSRFDAHRGHSDERSPRSSLYRVGKQGIDQGRRSRSASDHDDAATTDPPLWEQPSEHRVDLEDLFAGDPRYERRHGSKHKRTYVRLPLGAVPERATRHTP